MAPLRFPGRLAFGIGFSGGSAATKRVAIIGGCVRSGDRGSGRTWRGRIERGWLSWLGDLVRGWGFDVGTAVSDREVIGRLEAETRSGRPFDLLVLDCRMPGLDGLTTLRAIRANPYIEMQPAILLVTAYDTADLRAAWENRGAGVIK